MRLPDWNRVLLMFAHPDDEVNCYGTIRKLLDENGPVAIRHYACSLCGASLPEGFTEQDLLEECQLALLTRVGIEECAVWNFQVRHLPRYRQDILERMIHIREQFAPELIFTHSQYDLHQDHKVVHEEVVRAFKHSTILGVEQPQNMLRSQPTLYVRLTQQQVAVKVRAAMSYRSQVVKNLDYLDKTKLISVGEMRGMQCQYSHAEAFEVIRMVI